MKCISRFLPVLAIALAAGCNNDGSDKTTGQDSGTVINMDTARNRHLTHEPVTAPAPLVAHAEAVLTGTYPDTAVTGMARFDADSAGGGKVKMRLEINIPKKANKSVAVHLHEHGNCGDTAMLAHGHWNPGNTAHGKWGSDAFHAGDIGNVKLDAKGRGSITIGTDLWTLGGVPAKNILGKALIVHGGVDDFKTQPTGNAGTRIGCAVIQ